MNTETKITKHDIKLTRLVKAKTEGNEIKKCSGMCKNCSKNK